MKILRTDSVKYMRFLPNFLHTCAQTKYNTVSHFFVFVQCKEASHRGTYADSISKLQNFFTQMYTVLKMNTKRFQAGVVCTSVLPLVGGQGGLQPTRNLGGQLTLLQPGGQIMPTTLLLAHPDLKTQRHLCLMIGCSQ